MTTPALPRIVKIAISTSITSLECSADHTVVRINGHRAYCAYGHRWVEVDDDWGPDSAAELLERGP